MMKKMSSLSIIVFIITVVGFYCNFFKIHDLPNILIITTDDQGYGDVGFNGNQIVNTPTLDSISKNSVVFDRFYVSSDGAATQSSILTGRYFNTGKNFNRTNNKDGVQLTLSNVLKANNYQVGFFGYSYGLKPGTQRVSLNSKIHNKVGKKHMNKYANPISTNEHEINAITDSVIHYLKNENSIFLAFVDYRINNSISESTLTKHTDGLNVSTLNVYADFQNVDKNILRIIEALKQQKKIRNTILVYLGKNGPSFIRYNAGLKGRKHTIDEGGVRVPFFIHYPNGNFKNRRINEGFGAHIDLVPTLLDLCQIEYDSSQFEGVSFSDVLTCGNCNLPTRYFYNYQELPEKNTTSLAIRTSTLVLTLGANDTALYNLETDPSQQLNIYSKYPSIAKQFIDDFNIWKNSCDESKSRWVNKICKSKLELASVVLRE